MGQELVVRLHGQLKELPQSIIFRILELFCPGGVRVTQFERPHLEILGPFYTKRKKKWENIPHFYGPRPKVRLYLTGENTRYNHRSADFSISFDLDVASDAHFRMPFWWNSLDWSHLGLENLPTPRLSKLITVETLLQPLGPQALERPARAALFTSHLEEPRRTLYHEVSKLFPVDGYGPYFNRALKKHDLAKGGETKENILRGYRYSLCPENSMYPGYYTEKVVESFAAGSIPLTWADQNIVHEFQEGAFINLADYAVGGYRQGLAHALSPAGLQRLVSTPLLKRAPNLAGLIAFLERVVKRAVS